MGTSTPEAAVSITTALKGNADITVSNIVGSNILNILIILRISSVITALAVSRSTILYEIPFMIVITFVLLVQGMSGVIVFSEGIILLLFFLAYLGYLFVMAKKGNDVHTDETWRHKLWQSVLWTIAGLALIIVGSNVAVDAVSSIARIFGMSERFIGLTIVALGTSLPELFTSVSAARKKNIFAAIVGILLLACSVRHQKLHRKSGIIMLVSYMLYFVFICI